MDEQSDTNQEPATHWPTDVESGRRRLEAVLFIARTPLTSRRLSQYAGLEDSTQARTLVAELNRNYDQNGHSFQIKRIAGGYQLLTRPQFSKWLRQEEHTPRPIRLSRPALETLTVVAYRQPIIKADIEAIRGVACGEILRQLLDRDLVRICGRSEQLGRPFRYATTKEFLRLFGLRGLDDLPGDQQLVGEGLPNWNNFDQISSQSNYQPKPENGTNGPKNL